MSSSSELVSRLWRLCSLLRKDGVTYPQYVTELTYLIFLKLAAVRRKVNSGLPDGHRWNDLLNAEDDRVLDIYRDILAALGRSRGSRIMQSIFAGAATVIREPSTLRKLVKAIDAVEWFSDSHDAFGDAYEGLLQKNAEETKRGAGQYFTPRPLVDAIVRLTRPRLGEIVQDPAAGTGGFLIAADKAMRLGWVPSDKKEALFQSTQALRGVENVVDTYRLLCMNLYLHGIEAEHVMMGDTLSSVGNNPAFSNADVVLSNPPFGSAGGPPSRAELTITRRSTNFQLPFVEHCLRALAPGGRAAVIVPDNVLFEGGQGRSLRQALMRECDLHTILRLPTGIFYAQGVRTNVLFFSRPGTPQDADSTSAVWIYDMRAAYHGGDRVSDDLERRLSDFEEAFGPDPLGRSARTDGGELGRFRRFTREAIAARDDDLYITWLKEDGDVEEGLEHLPPGEVAAVLEQHLVLALGEIRALIDELDEDRLGAEIEE